MPSQAEEAAHLRPAALAMCPPRQPATHQPAHLRPAALAICPPRQPANHQPAHPRPDTLPRRPAMGEWSIPAAQPANVRAPCHHKPERQRTCGQPRWQCARPGSPRPISQHTCVQPRWQSARPGSQRPSSQHTSGQARWQSARPGRRFAAGPAAARQPGRGPAHPRPDTLPRRPAMGEWSIPAAQPANVRAPCHHKPERQRTCGQPCWQSARPGRRIRRRTAEAGGPGREGRGAACRGRGGTGRAGAERSGHHGRGRANESACKPDPVPTACGGRRPSIWAHRHRVPRAVHPRTRASSPSRASLHVHPRSRTASGATFDLAPGGVYRATPVTRGAGALLPHRFTLTAAQWARRSVFCGTVPRVAPGCR